MYECEKVSACVCEYIVDHIFRLSLSSVRCDTLNETHVVALIVRYYACDGNISTLLISLFALTTNCQPKRLCIIEIKWQQNC